MDRGVGAGDIIKVGKTVELECMDTPGHTMCHICLRSHGDEPALFSGDTLFNAGVGNCRGGGDPERLYETCASRLAALPRSTIIYPGHDYLVNNLRFTRHVEESNQAAADWLERSKDVEAEDRPLLTLGQELGFNSFFRLSEPGLIETLAQRVPALPPKPSPREVFLALRELRNSW